VFGARGATTALSRATAVLATVFMITSLSLAYTGTRSKADTSESVLEQLAGQGEADVPVVPVAPPVAPAEIPAPAPVPAPAK
jgi:preprotein translocase subunit SecG